MDSTLQRDAFLPQRPPGMGRGLAMAVLAHLMLIAALTFSVRWRASDPAGVEAELWAAVPQMAAPRAVDPPPPRPEAPRVQPRPAPPSPAPAPAPRVPDAQIAIEQARKVEQARRDEAERKETARKAVERETVREKAREKEAVRQREQAAQAQREKEELARQKKEQEVDAQRQAKALEAQREANLKRIAGMAGASGDANAGGSAAQSAGPSAGYAGRIRARIKPNIVFADQVTGNPVATVEVRVAPDGNITSRKIVKSSGIPAWDDAVLRAIDRTEVLPKDTDGRVPPLLQIEFRPRD